MDKTKRTHRYDGARMFYRSESHEFLKLKPSHRTKPALRRNYWGCILIEQGKGNRKKRRESPAKKRAREHRSLNLLSITVKIAEMAF